jgi:hypothetical protein
LTAAIGVENGLSCDQLVSTARRKAAVTKSLSIVSASFQPRMQGENRSSTTTRYSQPSRVGM